jgi:hypothetical protein
MSALPPKADIVGRDDDVRFVPKADIDKRVFTSRLFTGKISKRGIDG